MRSLYVLNELDNAGIVLKEQEGGEYIREYDMYIQHPAKKGERIALHDIGRNEYVIQYGYPFAKSKGIQKGEKITAQNTFYERENVNDIPYSEEEHAKWKKDMQVSILIGKGNTTFQGYLREDGKVGTRNYYVIFPLSQCASATADQIQRLYQDVKHDGLDGVVSLANTEGCGCTKNVQISRFLDIICAYIAHPNVFRVLALELGCEQTSVAKVMETLQKKNMGKYLGKIDFISIQGLGGSRNAICKAREIIDKNLCQASRCKKTQVGIDKIVLGTECGGSDIFSGITANNLIGKIADYIVDMEGSVILSEVPEMIGAERQIIRRCENREVSDKFIGLVNRYLTLAKQLGEDISDNLVPENINGGLINPAIKSLGAVIKGGTREIADVLEYGEGLRSRGLNIMQGPGNDMESVTGLIASGANIIMFSTGKGTVTGSSIVPVIKIPSTHEVFARMMDDMDIESEWLLQESDETMLRDKLAEVVDRVLLYASGEYTKAEKNGQNQFQVWTAGKLSV